MNLNENQKALLKERVDAGVRARDTRGKKTIFPLGGTSYRTLVDQAGEITKWGREYYRLTEETQPDRRVDFTQPITRKPTKNGNDSEYLRDRHGALVKLRTLVGPRSGWS